MSEHVRGKLTAPLMGIELSIGRLQKAINDIHAMVDGMRVYTGEPRTKFQRNK